MKYYNPEFIKQYIKQHRAEIEEVELGMDEDWFWTSETIFKDGKYSSRCSLDGNRITVAGIDGSVWATPIMAVTFKDGLVERVECWTADGKTEEPASIERCKAFVAELAALIAGSEGGGQSGKAESCEKCPFPDCEWDGVSAKEWAESRQRDADFRHANESNVAAQQRAESQKGVAGIRRKGVRI